MEMRFEAFDHLLQLRRLFLGAGAGGDGRWDGSGLEGLAGRGVS